ncbi:2-phosphosulfolactate phosphatase [Pantoea vagans]|uniref:2-phosphosulfolactate phosphatase n=1 Tax=Pantoea vagans TaxID=470934 RepID=UPI003FA3CE22
MQWWDQERFSVRLEWGTAAISYAAKDVECIVIVDVMSFSTCVSLAVDNGAQVYPYPWKDASAISFASSIGARVGSYDRLSDANGFSLSPASIRKIEAGEKLVLPSPNGSAISFLARDVDAGVTVFSGCFRNLTQTAKACRDFRRILVIPCGERWPNGTIRPAIEDYAAAGGIIAAIGHDRCSPEAAGAVAAWQQLNLLSLRECASALELQQRGFQEDVDLCLDLDSATRVCQLQGDFYTAGLKRG